MATRSPVSNPESSPRYRVKTEDDENDAQSKSTGSRNRNNSRSRSVSRSRSGSPSKFKSSKQKAPIKQNNGRRHSRSPVREDRKRRSTSRERNGPNKSTKRHRRSRSRSHGSRSPVRREQRRSRSPAPHSRSPQSSRGGRRTAPDPNPSRCVAAFGLSVHTRERELRDIFSQYGPLEDVQVVYDKQSGRSRGFAFIYFRNVDDAVIARNKLTGQEVDGRQIRVDFSTTRRPHSPTPGIYMGRVSASERERYRRGDVPSRSDRSPRRRNGRSRSPFSRSRSPSPPHRRRDF